MKSHRQAYDRRLSRMQAQDRALVRAIHGWDIGKDGQAHRVNGGALIGARLAARRPHLYVSW